MLYESRLEERNGGSVKGLRRAIVIGGSIGGMMAARVLADHYDEVIIVERDHIPPGTEIGYDAEHDRARGFTVSEGGVVVIAKADGVEHFLEPELARR